MRDASGLSMSSPFRYLDCHRRRETGDLLGRLLLTRTSRFINKPIELCVRAARRVRNIIPYSARRFNPNLCAIACELAERSRLGIDLTRCIDAVASVTREIALPMTRRAMRMRGRGAAP